MALKVFFGGYRNASYFVLLRRAIAIYAAQYNNIRIRMRAYKDF